jgi:hypothetical protein
LKTSLNLKNKLKTVKKVFLNSLSESSLCTGSEVEEIKYLISLTESLALKSTDLLSDP